jgi:poly-gamma-glutamate synthesis protein (capsule biosynthesis protein)
VSDTPSPAKETVLHEEVLRTWEIIPPPAGGSRPAVTLIAVGDIMLCRAVGDQIRAHGPDFPFELVRPLLAQGDVAFANLETPIARPLPGIAVPPHNGFRSDPLCAEALRRAGFTIVSRANNHALDCLAVGVEETDRYLQDAGISWAGVGDGLGGARQPTVVEASGIKIGFLARTHVPKLFAKADGKRVALLSRREILRAVEALRRQVDYCVVSLHLGQEVVDHPMPEDVRLARELVERGTDLVIGHHPHVTQGVERWGRGLIAYSLGNFVFHRREGAEGDSAILRCHLAGGEVVGAELIPVITGADFRPRPAQGEQGETILRRVQALSTQLGTRQAAREFWDQAATRFARRERRALRHQLPRYGWRFFARRARGMRWMHLRLGLHALRRALGRRLRI